MKRNIGILLIIVSIMWVLHTFSKILWLILLLKNLFLKGFTSCWWITMDIHDTTSYFAGYYFVAYWSIRGYEKIRIKSMTFHRWNGRFYVLSIILNFIPGLYVSFFATGGWLSTIGFLILNSLWLATTCLGYWNIKKQKVMLHSQWMIRSFFLSFSNMLIYIIVAITYNLINMPYEISYIIAVWLCWMINLLVAEIIIRKKICL